MIMSATFETPKSTSTVNKPLWAAVGVLAVVVLALGGALIYTQTRPPEPSAAVLSAPAPTSAPALTGSAAPLAAPTAADDGVQVLPQKRHATPIHHAQPAPKYVASRSDRSMASNASTNGPEGRANRPICANCGTISAVTPIQRDGTGSGGGAVAGGVLGAIVGNQVGAGNGKTLATIVGAVGGGFAGNTVEKKMKKVTVYEVRVRMQDGSTRSVEQSSPATVGAKVMVEGNSLQPAGD
jgi:outer membrane lipoprotein SlyB